MSDESSSDSDCDGSNTRTDLHRAAAEGDLATVQQLLRSGANIDGESSVGMTPLSNALRKHHVAVAKFLVGAGANVNASGGGIHPILDAASIGDLDLIACLVDRGADINAKDDSGFTVLMRAESIQTLELLLRLGARPDERNRVGRTACEEHRYQAAARQRDLERQRAHATRLVEAAGYDATLQALFRQNTAASEHRLASRVQMHETLAEYLER